MIHWHTGIWKWQESTSVSPLIQKIICFIFVRATVACKIPWVDLRFWALIWDNCSKVFEACYSTQLLPFTLISLEMSFALFVIIFVFSAMIFILYLVQVLSRLSTKISNSCSSSTRASVSSANHFLPPVLTIPSCSSRAQVIILRESCWRPWVREGVLA